jgi:clan AA aspartic protease (TIGR02281 family)
MEGIAADQYEPLLTWRRTAKPPILRSIVFHGRITMPKLQALLVALCLTGLSAAAGAAEPVCVGEQYYAPDDYGLERPLPRPHAELARIIRQARKGVALEQRNLAVSYEAGYLVARCPGKAAYWYEQAAAKGDATATQWMAKQREWERMRAGPECGGAGCPLARRATGVVELYAEGPNGHFHVPVTIGDVTVQGVVDTGASSVSINATDAQRMRLPYRNGQPLTIMTANGAKNGFRVMLESVTVGGITLNNVEGTVSEGSTPLLLGMSFLRRVNVSIRSTRMTLSVP